MNKLFMLLILTFNIGYLYANSDELPIKPAKFYEEQGHKNFELGNIEEAYKDFIQVIKTGDPTADIYNKLGEIEYSKKNIKQAFSYFDNAIKLDPKNAEVYRYRGIMYFLLGNKTKAFEDINKALELNPKNAKAHNNLGVLNSESGNIEEAIRNFTKAIELNPNSIKPYNNLGKALGTLGYYDKAINNFNQVIKRGSQADRAEAYYNRGVASLIKDSIENILAVKDISKAIELGYKTASAYKLLGFALITVSSTNEEFKSAIKILDKVIELGVHPVELAIAYSYRALARTLITLTFNFGEKNKLLKVLADYNKSLELDPTSAKNYNRRGVVKFKLGDQESASLDFQKAAEINPKLAVAYNNVAIILTNLGFYNRVTRNFVRAIELDPSLGTLKNRGKSLSTVIYPYEFDAIFSQKSEVNRSKAKQIVDLENKEAQSVEGKGENQNAGACSKSFVIK